ncbi:nuclear transport factor 2 family protein [Immundisolibacter sp.]|uniref:nuclear transport factor 2 family protein n=1 Tax=Immundisolibacter sp. TaxID=1934948 RepID=UPI0035652F19
MADDDIARRLARLESLEAIRDLIAGYARGADRNNDPAIMAPLFAEDATWAAKGFGPFKGRDAIAQGLAATGRTDILWSLHYMISPLIELAADGRTAAGNWYLWELATMPGKTADQPDSIWVGGTYQADFSQQDGRWYFQNVWLEIRLATPFEEPWAGRPLRRFE